jgi:hypothetical protein
MNKHSNTITPQQALDFWLAGVSIKELEKLNLDSFQLMALESLFYSLDKILDDKEIKQ